MGVTAIPARGMSPVGNWSDTTPVIRTMFWALNVVPSITRSNVRSMAVTALLRTKLSDEAAAWPGTLVETSRGPVMATGRAPTTYGSRNGTAELVGFGTANASGALNSPLASMNGAWFSVPSAFWSMKLPFDVVTPWVTPWMVRVQLRMTPESPDARSVTRRVQVPAGAAANSRASRWVGR